jgi:hypothetical protein
LWRWRFRCRFARITQYEPPIYCVCCANCRSWQPATDSTSFVLHWSSDWQPCKSGRVELSQVRFRGRCTWKTRFGSGRETATKVVAVMVSEKAGSHHRQPAEEKGSLPVRQRAQSHGGLQMPRARIVHDVMVDALGKSQSSSSYHRQWIM